MALRGRVQETPDGDVIIYDERGNEILTIDMSASGRKVTFAPGAGLATPEHIDTADLADEAVTTGKLADGAATKVKLGAGTVKVETVDVDASAGGSAQTEAIVVLPAGAVVLDVHARCTEAFDGDTTQDLSVGVAGTAAKYLASTDFENGADDVNADDEAFASTLGTPTTPVSVPAGESIIATWTNTANATEGSVRVSVTYYVEDV
jgi:hypothetical protein